MPRRYGALFGFVGLILGIGFLAIRFFNAAPPLSRFIGDWERHPLTNTNEALEDYRRVSADPHRLPAILIFHEGGKFTVRGPASCRNTAQELCPGPYHGTYSFVDAQHIKLTIGSFDTIYEVHIENECGAPCNHYLASFTLHNEQVTYTFYRTQIVLEM